MRKCLMKSPSEESTFKQYITNINAYEAEEKGKVFTKTKIETMARFSRAILFLQEAYLHNPCFWLKHWPIISTIGKMGDRVIKLVNDVYPGQSSEAYAKEIVASLQSYMSVLTLTGSSISHFSTARIEERC